MRIETLDLRGHQVPLALGHLSGRKVRDGGAGGNVFGVQSIPLDTTARCSTTFRPTAVTVPLAERNSMLKLRRPCGNMIKKPRQDERHAARAASLDGNKRNYPSIRRNKKRYGKILTWLRIETDEASGDTPANSRPVRLALFTMEGGYELHFSSFLCRTLSGLVAPGKLRLGVLGEWKYWWGVTTCNKSCGCRGGGQDTTTDKGNQRTAA